ncbi:MAG TPA: HAMP domain-containing sensor histidine kinase [Pyrinomonadaceae bacterium]|jgi:signal transduction histidine kinase|nr:HAMP domain-containing sensor histidine kinase [Pyrinomonadaceae bacterium]
MRPLKLHTKTTLLASAITLAVLGVVLALVSVRFAQRVRDQQKEVAQLQAGNLADHISKMPAPHEPAQLAGVATLVHGSRPDSLTVRVWERVGGLFVEVAASSENRQAEEIPDEVKAALRSGLATKVVEAQPADADDSLYRVFAPVLEDGRVSGAVEVIEKLDSAPSIAWDYGRGALWLAPLAVFLITLGIFLLFRHFVYQPVERLLGAMEHVRAGDLGAQAPEVARDDEMGTLTRGFNRMLARLREMTAERETQSRILERRVGEATSELAERNEQLEDANLELYRTARRLTELERLAAAGQLAAQFAHEVGTPLNLISGHVQLLLASGSHDLDAERTRLQTISQQIERIERIVRRMLDSTRPEAGEHAPLDLNALLRRTFDAAAPTLDASRVRLDAELDSPALPHVNGDPDRLQQVFINLVNNALDAMPEGGELRVTTSFEPDDAGGGGAGRVVVDFADTGTGMTEEVRAHIFDPLYTTKKRGRGTGLGLVVVRQVIGEHGGSIEVESEPGRGARFRLSFPAAETEDVAAGAALVPARLSAERIINMDGQEGRERELEI